MKKIFIISIIVTLNLYANSTNITKVVVKKSQKVLLLMSKDKIINRFHISLGGNPKGHKVKQGDQKTPEGNYTLDYKNSNSHFYKSIHISYPNKKDKQRAKKLGVNPGGDIFIHGQKNGLGWLYFLSRFFNWTEGCIAVSNSDMDIIWSKVKIGTPIEIKP
jgi:murein L,D-transpeptidase YafK